MDISQEAPALRDDVLRFLRQLEDQPETGSFEASRLAATTLLEALRKDFDRVPHPGRPRTIQTARIVKRLQRRLKVTSGLLKRRTAEAKENLGAKIGGRIQNV